IKEEKEEAGFRTFLANFDEDTQAKLLLEMQKAEQYLAISRIAPQERQKKEGGSSAAQQKLDFLVESFGKEWCREKGLFGPRANIDIIFLNILLRALPAEKIKTLRPEQLSALQERAERDTIWMHKPVKVIRGLLQEQGIT
ncbi:MAG: hypothetical protein HQ596_00945, partial [Candidatus Saganbacteria bacterium]|nr:hypothetical protein [Candidatus Saganbacteria bacterium]